MKRLSLLLLTICIYIQLSAQSQYPIIVVETSLGDIKIMLYDNTFRHSDNFVKLVNEGYYNGQLFHRVINNFMIQTGDDNSIDAKPGVMLGTGGKNYTIDAEFFPEYYHKKGAIAAARQGDNTNPLKKSSGSQFYIVQGKPIDEPTLNMLVQRGMHPPFTDEQIKTYSTIGGTPHLDYSYTVFGEVIEGIEVLDKIAAVAKDKNDRPIEDVKILRMYTVKK
jgi:cyclophilin family peptidyl-prolyl cis-trans isomerase